MRDLIFYLGLELRSTRGYSSWAMSRLLLFLMNKLDQTESAIFKFRMLYFQRIPFQIIPSQLHTENSVWILKRPPGLVICGWDGTTRVE